MITNHAPPTTPQSFQPGMPLDEREKQAVIDAMEFTEREPGVVSNAHYAARQKIEHGVPGIVLSLELARIINGAFLPRNPNKMRAAAPEVVEAAHDFKRLLAQAPDGSIPCPSTLVQALLKAFAELENAYDEMSGFNAAVEVFAAHLPPGAQEAFFKVWRAKA